MTAATMAKPRTGIPVKSIALPIEHGSWGFLLEPLVLGVVLAPSLAAPFISTMMIGAFLLRQPLKFLIADWKQGRTLPRTVMAKKFGMIFGGIAAFGLIASLITAPLQSFIPLAIAAPLAVYLMLQDAARQSRELIPELVAAFALSSSTAALIVAGSGSWPLALAMWGVMLARLVPSIIYVRNRLRLEKGKDFSRLASPLVHLTAVAGVMVLFVYRLVPFLPVVMMAFLLSRSVVGLSPIRIPAKAKQIGVEEVIYGALTVISVVAGFYLTF